MQFFHILHNHELTMNINDITPFFRYGQPQESKEIYKQFVNQLVDIYSVYNPAKLSEIPVIVQHYKGREDLLLDQLKLKYAHAF